MRNAFGRLVEKLGIWVRDRSKRWEEWRKRRKELRKQRQKERERRRKQREAFEALENIERRLEMRSIAARQLHNSFRKLNSMTGREFESFIAPAGYTEGARQLADRLEVELYTRTDIRGWIERVNLSDTPESYMTDDEIYEALLEQHSEYIDLLIETGKVRARAGQNSEVRQRFDQVRSGVEDRLEEIQNKLEQVLPRTAELTIRSDKSNQSETRKILALRRAEARQVTTFLDLSIQEDIPISNYVTNPNENIHESSEGSTETAVLRPRIVVDAEVDGETILKLSKRALNEHVASYPMKVDVEPQLEYLSPGNVEESAGNQA